MDTTTLEYLIAIADEQSITRAADKFFLSQPALSQQLKKVENELGAPLFTRSKNNWQLTDIGKVYINSARSILHIYNTSISRIDELRILHNEKINLIVASGVHNFVRKIILPIFNESYPDIQINFQIADNIQIQDYMLNGLPYLAILFSHNGSSNLFDTYTVFEDELYLCISKNHKLNRNLQDNFNVEILKDELFILSKSGTTHREVQEDFFRKINIIPRVIGESSTFSGAIHMLKNGYGCTFLPKALCQNKSDIFDCYNTSPICAYNVKYGYAKGQTITEPYKKMIEIIEDKFKNEFVKYSSSWVKELEEDIMYNINI